MRVVLVTLWVTGLAAGLFAGVGAFVAAGGVLQRLRPGVYPAAFASYAVVYRFET